MVKPVSEEPELKNPYYTCLDRIVANIKDPKNKGVQADFKGYVEFVFECLSEKLPQVGKMCIRYYYLSQMSDEEIKRQNRQEEEVRIARLMPEHVLDPVEDKLWNLCYSKTNESLGQMAEESRRNISKLVWAYQKKIEDRTMTEQEYTYFLNTPVEQILLKLEMENLEIYKTRNEGRLKDQTNTKHRIRIIGNKHETQRINITDPI